MAETESPVDVLIELAHQIFKQKDFVKLYFGSHVIEACSLIQVAPGVLEGQVYDDGQTFRFMADTLIGVIEGTGYNTPVPD